MFNGIKHLFKKKKAKENKLNIVYTNEITFTDIDKNSITIKVREAGDKSFLYLYDSNEKKSLVFDQDAAYFLISILTDYAENGNLNKIEEILETGDING
jgi:lysyl-tRNA synthetase class II